MSPVTTIDPLARGEYAAKLRAEYADLAERGLDGGHGYAYRYGRLVEAARLLVVRIDRGEPVDGCFELVAIAAIVDVDKVAGEAPCGDAGAALECGRTTSPASCPAPAPLVPDAGPGSRCPGPATSPTPVASGGLPVDGGDAGRRRRPGFATRGAT